MDLFIRYGGWCVAALLALTLGAILFSLHDHHQQIAGLQSELEQVRMENAALRKASTIRTTLPAKPAPFPAPALHPKTPAAGSGASSPEDTPPSGASPDAQRNPGESSLAPGQFNATPEIREQSAEMSLTMMYGDLFQQLNLPPDVENQVRAILKRFILDKMEMTGNQNEPGGPGAITVNDGFGKHTPEDKVRLLAELRNVLSPEELAIVDEYEDTLPERMLDAAYDMQLHVYAPALTPENHQMVKDVFVDEMLAIQPGFVDPANGPVSQTEAYQRALDRLAPNMDPAQFTLVENFVRQQEEMNRAAGAPRIRL
ncbi:MAG TPA: hypothetical protein PLI09_25090 [Candidatus Hydrogenedentes bacterium]|nr:hypothetical protein [Candidatus Hydrogenedentota bacterium]